MQALDGNKIIEAHCNGYKLALMYLVMFVPLLLNGAGKPSLDHWLSRQLMPR